MKRYLAMACGAALSVALAGSSFAQTPTTGADRQGGESSGQSAFPNPDKDKAKTNPNMGGTTGGPAAANPPPPSTDRPAGEASGQSSYPNPDKPKQ
jgi:hypothetical protein